MRQFWGPSASGRFFTFSEPWSLTLQEGRFVLRVGGTEHTGDSQLLKAMLVRPGLFWTSLTVPLSNGATASLDGIPNDAAQEMALTISCTAIAKWAEIAQQACNTQLRTKGWLTNEFAAAIDDIKPTGLVDCLAKPDAAAHLAAQSQSVREAVKLWRHDFFALADGINQRHLQRQLAANKEFFDTVEKSPLTEEQSRAVICLENRVLLVAAAGSGKTSTMVAKTGYVLKNNYFDADKILLLAFNNDAAAELRERIKARLGPLGLPVDKVVAKTFHAFGLDVIGQATGKRPSLAPWVENGRDLDTLLELVDELKDRDSGFRASWDLFRVVLAQDLPKFGKEEESPEHWDSKTRTAGFWTLNNECVKSRGEQLLANWFFYNGVSYLYEAPYAFETADAQHRQYRPDFFFPDANTYLEHWALDQDGNPPAEFTGYAEGMAWKKQLHVKKGTKLLETTMADLWTGSAFEYLTEELSKLGINLDPNPDRPAHGRKPIENSRLVRTFRSFLTHAKSNRLTAPELRNRLRSGAAGQFRFRHEVFLHLFEKISAAWEAKLRQETVIDFDDMLNLAADCVEDGRWKSTYELVMVDEFQDVSRARARLVAGLLNERGRCFFAVGDDWQSINRFAGSDLSVMTDFASLFGKTTTLKLESTFRCPQSLCDITSSFVQKNPKQIRKAVRSAKPDIQKPLRILQVPTDTAIRAAVLECIKRIDSELPEGTKRAKVFVLGRYNHDKNHVPANHRAKNLDVQFVTAHSSKGREADYVIVPRVTSDTLGFPSGVADDPVLQLAMPAIDAFELAEERRLFYVALTRAKSSVTLITVEHKVSPFIAELVRDHKVVVTNLDGSESDQEVCPVCHEGFLTMRTSKYGPFLRCSRFPRCKYKRNVAQQAQPQLQSR